MQRHAWHPATLSEENYRIAAVSNPARQISDAFSWPRNINRLPLSILLRARRASGLACFRISGLTASLLRVVEMIGRDLSPQPLD
jgi:hypothetical protein